MKKLRCKFTRHELRPVSYQPLLIKEFECSRCQQKFTEDCRGRIVKFTRYWEENHEFFQKYFRNRITPQI